MKDFKKLYRAGRVKRYHTTDLTAQTLGHHMWGVALIVAMIYPDGVSVPSRVLMAALTHDLAEIDTGDVPATAKWSSGDLTDALEGAEMGFNRAHGLDYDLSDGEAKMLSWADTFELCLYCRHQINTGNEYAEEILLNGLEHLRKKGFPTPKSKELYDAIFG